MWHSPYHTQQYLYVKQLLLCKLGCRGCCVSAACFSNAGARPEPIEESTPASQGLAGPPQEAAGPSKGNADSEQVGFHWIFTCSSKLVELMRKLVRGITAEETTRHYHKTLSLHSVHMRLSMTVCNAAGKGSAQSSV